MLLLSAFALGSAPMVTALFIGTFDSSTGVINAELGQLQITGASNVQVAPAPDGGKMLQIKNLTSEKVSMLCKFANDAVIYTGPLSFTFEAILATRDSPFDNGIQTDNPAGDIIPATGSDSTNHLIVAGKVTGVSLPSGIPIQFTAVYNRSNPAFDWNYTIWAQVLTSAPGANSAVITWTGSVPNTANVGITGIRFEKKAGTPGTLGLDDIFAAGPPQ